MESHETEWKENQKFTVLSQEISALQRIALLAGWWVTMSCHVGVIWTFYLNLILIILCNMILQNNFSLSASFIALAETYPLKDLFENMDNLHLTSPQGTVQKLRHRRISKVLNVFWSISFRLENTTLSIRDFGEPVSFSQTCIFNVPPVSFVLPLLQWERTTFQ